MEKNQWMKKENILENKMEGQIAKKAAGNCRLQRERSILALCLALTEGLLLPFTAFSAENMPRYHENYYALLSPVGEWREGSIVRQYEARGSKSVTDYGTYTKIKNLSNGVDAETSGDRHVFHFSNGAPESLFIEGETKEPFGILPWNIAISYELNGVEVDPSVLAGEKGLVRIHVEFKRNPNAQEYAKKNYVLICRANFTMEDILSLKAEKAEVVSLGEKKEVLVVLLPGEEDAFTIEVGTNAFEFDGLQFQMMPLRSAQVDRIKDLQNAKSDMEDSYHALKDAGDALLNSLDESQQSLRSMQNSLKEANGLAKASQEEGKAYQAERDQSYAALDRLTESLSPLSGNGEDWEGTIRNTKEDIERSKDSVNRLENSLSDLENAIVGIRGDVPDSADLEKAEKTIEALNGMMEQSQGKTTTEVIQSLNQSLAGNPLHDTVMQLVNGYAGLSMSEAETKKKAQKLLTESLMPALQSLSSHARENLSTGQDSLSVLEDSIPDIKALQEDLISASKTAEELTKNADTLLENSQIAMKATTDSLRNQDSYLRGKRDELFNTMEKNLNAAESSLKNADSALDSTKSMKSAKDAMEGLIEKKWDENTGEKTTVFEMDPNQAPESLLPNQNTNIADVAVSLRTEEIKLDKSKGNTTEESGKLSIWQKISAVFSKMFSCIGKFFKGGK